MENMIYYKEDIKDNFLKQFDNEQTREVYGSIFKKSKTLEEKYNTDILDFNEELLKDLIKNHIKPKTKQSARTYLNILSSYIDWGIENGFTMESVNLLSKGQEYFTSFVREQNKLYMSKTQIDSIIFNLVNAQDSFIIQALFDGIEGKEVSELTLLTRSQIEDAQKTGWLNLIDLNGNERTIKPSIKTLDLAELAMDDFEYYKQNGKVDYIDNITDVVKLSASEYVLKPTVTSKSSGYSKPVSRYTVYNRLEMIKNLPEFSEYKEALSTKNIVRSGMLYEAKKILDNKGVLNKASIELICNKFGISYKWSLKDFLNEDTVNEVYYR